MISKLEKTIISLVDYTSLNENDTADSINNFLDLILNNDLIVAGYCIYPKFVSLVKEKAKNTNAKVVTVVNFPKGNDPIMSVVSDTKQAIINGADEIDVVINYKDYITSGSSNYSKELVHQVKLACGSKILKVIIESGELNSSELIKKASEDAISSGANFLKTSTGKVKINATLEAANIMLNVIKMNNPEVGFKAAGGIRTEADALEYINLAENLLGKDYISPEKFRIGASSIVSNIYFQNAQKKGQEENGKKTNSSKY